MGDYQIRPELLDRSLDAGFGEFDDDQLAELVLDAERLFARLQSVQSQAITALGERRCVNRVKHRSERLWMANELRLPTAAVGRRFRRAELLDGILAPALPLLHDARILPEHLDVLAKYANISRFAEVLERDLSTLLVWAQTETFPYYKTLVEGWAEMMDPLDPAELNDANLDARGIAWSQGLDREVMVELNTTALCWEQVLSAARPIYDRMLTEEWDTAREEHGELATGADLVRSDKQRWHDAFMEVIRHGIANLKQGSDPAAASFDVGVVVDLETLERETVRVDAAATEPQPDSSGPGERRLAAYTKPFGTQPFGTQPFGTQPSRPVEDAHQYRCETVSGLRLTPREALHAALAGSIRRVTLGLPDLDFSVSKKTRLFKGPIRLGIMIRDRYCQHPGCDTHANRCEADHHVPVEHGGLTEPRNGRALCKPCHRHKTRLQAQGLL